MLVSLAAVSLMDPYDSDSSDGGPEFPLQSVILETPSFHDPSYETYKRGQQFMIVDRTANQRNGSDVSKIWQHADGTPGGDKRRSYLVDRNVGQRQTSLPSFKKRKQQASARLIASIAGSTVRLTRFNNRAEICTLRSQTHSFSTTLHLWLYLLRNCRCSRK